MKVFHVFQTDTPGKTGRHFIRGCLDAAVEKLKTTLKTDIEEPIEREKREAIHVEQGREGVTGIPDLARTIFDKIDQAAAIVADVTFVSTIEDMKGKVLKRNPNPNVMVELGYALKVTGEHNILLVMNTYYGGPEELPFDINRRGWPIEFKLAPNASKAVRDKAAEQVTAQLVKYLSPILVKRASGQTTAPESAFAKVPHTFTKAVYFKPGEILANFGEPSDTDQADYTYQDGNAFYLRLIPNRMPEQPFLKNELHWLLTHKMPFALARQMTQLVDANDYGAIVIQPESISSGWIRASTQLFQNGEIWGVAPWLLRPQDGSKRVGQQVLEDTYRQVLGRYAKLMSEEMKFEPPYTLEAGAVGLVGYHVAIGNQPDDNMGPIRDAEFNISLELSDLRFETLDSAVVKISEALFKLTGYRRPT